MSTFDLWVMREDRPCLEGHPADEAAGRSALRALSVPAAVLCEGTPVAVNGHVSATIVGRLRLAAAMLASSRRGGIERAEELCVVPGCNLPSAPYQRRLDGALRPLCRGHRVTAQGIRNNTGLAPVEIVARMVAAATGIRSRGTHRRSAA